MVRLIGIALVLVAVALAATGLIVWFQPGRTCCTLLQTLAVWLYMDMVGVLLAGGALLIRRG
jgi:hypothetical protein